MTDATLLWSIGHARRWPFHWACTRSGFRRFVAWVTALALNVEEHTITQSVLALDRPADWKALESFAEYGAWDAPAVTRNLTRLVEQAPGRIWHGYHGSAVDDTTVHRNSQDVWGYPFQGALVSNPRPYYPWGFAPQGGEAAMIDEILQKFLDKKPIAVIVGATIARTIGDSVLDDIFERHADGQYTRELTFSALSRLMTQVVFCTYPSVNAAYQANPEIPVSITSVYNKLNGLATGVSQALVAETAGAMNEILTALPHPPDEPVKGLRLRTLDGNFLAGTDHRLACLRGCGA